MLAPHAFLRSCRPHRVRCPGQAPRPRGSPRAPPRAPPAWTSTPAGKRAARCAPAPRCCPRRRRCCCCCCCCGRRLRAAQVRARGRGGAGGAARQGAGRARLSPGAGLFRARSAFPPGLWNARAETPNAIGRGPRRGRRASTMPRAPSAPAGWGRRGSPDAQRAGPADSCPRGRQTFVLKLRVLGPAAQLWPAQPCRELSVLKTGKGRPLESQPANSSRDSGGGGWGGGVPEPEPPAPPPSFSGSGWLSASPVGLPAVPPPKCWVVLGHPGPWPASPALYPTPNFWTPRGQFFPGLQPTEGFVAQSQEMVLESPLPGVWLRCICGAPARGLP